MADDSRGPVVLCVVAGLGVRDGRAGNAYQLAETPALDALFGSAPTRLEASGSALGVTWPQPGNGELGNRTLGAGRVVPSARGLFEDKRAKKKLSFVPAIDNTVRTASYNDGRVHLIGLLSDGGVHSHIDHLFELIDIFNFNELPVVVHAILDGRDCGHRSAQGYLNALEGRIADMERVVLGTVGGRHWAMDSSGRWDRVYKAFHAMVRDKTMGAPAPKAENPFEVLSGAYGKGVPDDLVEPTRIGDYEGITGDFVCDFSSGLGEPVWEWTGFDAGMLWNVRGDRMRQLGGMLTRTDVPAYVLDDLLMDRRFPVRAFQPKYLASLASLGGESDIAAAFTPPPVEATLGEVLAQHGLTQLRCSETEHSPHVTRFFDCGMREPLDGETRKLARSPRLVDSFAQQPEMATPKIIEAVVAALEAENADFVLVHFPAVDAVAHSGDLDATMQSLTAVDDAIATLQRVTAAKGGTLIVTSDHGNCEEMTDKNGSPMPSHTANRVPFALSSDDALRPEGTLCDVAPTVLDLFGLDIPHEMTGSSLRVDNPKPPKS